MGSSPIGATLLQLKPEYNSGMITFNKIPVETVDVYKDGVFFATVNQFEFNDIRIQIMRERAENFTVLFDGVHIVIDKNGRINNWPHKMFSLLDEQLGILIGWDDFIKQDS